MATLTDILTKEVLEKEYNEKVSLTEGRYVVVITEIVIGQDENKETGEERNFVQFFVKYGENEVYNNIRYYIHTPGGVDYLAQTISNLLHKTIQIGKIDLNELVGIQCELVVTKSQDNQNYNSRLQPRVDPAKLGIKKAKK